MAKSKPSLRRFLAHTVAGVLLGLGAYGASVVSGAPLPSAAVGIIASSPASREVWDAEHQTAAKTALDVGSWVLAGVIAGSLAERWRRK